MGDMGDVFNDMKKSSQDKLEKNREYSANTLQKKGIESLKKHIVKMFFHGEVVKSDGLLINNLRHKQILQQCYESLINAIKISR